MNLSRRVFAAALVSGTLAVGLSAGGAGERPANQPVCSLIVTFGPDFQKSYGRIPWTAGMTVEDALKRARELPPPKTLAYQTKGTGERTFLLSIDGMENEGGGAERRNWLYRVNDKPGTTSMAVAEVRAGDIIEWRFTTMDWAFKAE